MDAADCLFLNIYEDRKTDNVFLHFIHTLSHSCYFIKQYCPLSVC